MNHSNFKKRFFDSNLSSVNSKDDIPQWVKLAYNDFIRTIITDEQVKFPCFYAENAFKKESMFFSYLEEKDLSIHNDLLSINVDLFLKYTNDFKNFPVFIVFVKASDKEQDINYYEEIFWDILNSLIKNNPSKKIINTDTASTNWKLNFSNTSLFINGHCKAYKMRKSRKSFSDLMLVIQDYKNLYSLEKNNSSVSDLIRANVLKYDGMPISNVFGNDFSDKNCLDWKMFWLEDQDNSIDIIKKCTIKYL